MSVFIDEVHRILYEEVDESDVLLFKFPSSQPVDVEYEEYRFPRAGTHNAKSKLKMVQFTLSETLHIQDICVKDLQYPLTYYFPWMEYIVRVGWTPNSKSVWAQLLNRQQKRIDLILIPLDNFCEICSSSSLSSSPIINSTTDHSWQSTLGRLTSPIQVIYSQTSTTWINVNDLLQFIEFKNSEVTFIWASEETGFRHLYLITASLHQGMNGVTHTNDSSTTLQVADNVCDGITLKPRYLSKTQLTSGDWEVLGRNIWFDRARRLVYFLGLRETPLEKHLYVVSLSRPEHIRLLTKPGFSYSVEFNEECTILIQVFCNIHHLPTCEVYHVVQTNTVDIDDVDGLQLRCIGYLFEGGIPSNAQLQKFSPSIYSRHITSGELLYGMVFKPHNFKHGQRYPTVLNVYGGPEVQTVNNTFKVNFNFLHLIYVNFTH